METQLYFITQLSFITLSLGLLLLIVSGLKVTLDKTIFSPAKQRTIFRGTVIILSLWIIFLSIFSLAGFFQDFNSFPPKLFIVIVAPLTTMVVISFSPVLGEIINHVPHHWLVGIQAFRIPVEILLWMLFVTNLAPVQLTFEGRNMDILSGLLAIPVAIYATKTKSRSILTAYNIFGLLLLINIVVTAMLSVPSPFRVFTNEPANTVVSHFPIIFLPGVLVPIAYYMHIFSIKKLMIKRSAIQN